MRQTPQQTTTRQQKQQQGEYITMANNNNNKSEKNLSRHLVPFITWNTAGDVDERATLDKFRAAVQEYSVEFRRDLSAARDVVHAIFDELPEDSASLKKDALIGMAVSRLNPDVDSYSSIAQSVAAVLDDRSQFEVSRGRGGGVRRIAAPAEPEAPRRSSPAPRASQAPARQSQRPSSRAAAR